MKDGLNLLHCDDYSQRSDLTYRYFFEKYPIIAIVTPKNVVTLNVIKSKKKKIKPVTNPNIDAAKKLTLSIYLNWSASSFHF